jgi:multiple sugar transport system substrate-binding protein
MNASAVTTNSHCRTRFACLLLMTALALMTVSCGRDRDTRPEIRYMAWGNPEQLAVEQQLVDEFMKREPGIRVRMFKVPQSAYLNKMIIMLASRTAPDVIRVDHYNFPDLVRKEYFYDLTALAAADPSYHESDFFPIAVEECKYRGRLYALDVLLGGSTVYYNKTLFEKAGLEDPNDLAARGEWTWDKLREYAQKLTKTDASGRPERYGIILPAWPQSVVALRAFGGDLLSPDGKRCALDSPGSIRGFQFLADLRYKDHVSPTPSQSAQSAFSFETGRVGMTFDWMGMAPRYRKVKSFQWDICPVPRGPVSGSTILKGNQLVMYRECPHPQEAWKFMRFLTGPEAEMRLYGSLRRGDPSRKSVAYAPEFLKTKQPPFHTGVYLTAVENGRPLPIDARWFEWVTAMNAELDNLWSGRERSAAVVLHHAADKVNAVLASEEGY